MVKIKSPVHIADLAVDQLKLVPGMVVLVEQIGVRSYLLVPTKDEELVDGITIVRPRGAIHGQAV
jgi:hypothetical protein